jgi:hypothetical protein
MADLIEQWHTVAVAGPFHNRNDMNLLQMMNRMILLPLMMEKA